jgi:hypothetical protein
MNSSLWGNHSKGVCGSRCFYCADKRDSGSYHVTYVKKHDQFTQGKRDSSPYKKGHKEPTRWWNMVRPRNDGYGLRAVKGAA